MTKKLAKSLSGHDKDQYYVVLKADQNMVWLTDGKLKPMDKPKKKNIKHIQIINRLPEGVEQLLASDELTDLVIKRALKLYLMNE